MRQRQSQELGLWVPAPAAASASLLAVEEDEKGLCECVSSMGAAGRAVLLCIQDGPFAHLEMLEQTLVKAGFYGN